MGEASSVKVSDREIFASCNLGDTFKVWSLVYTRRYSLHQDESIGFVAEQWLGKSSGSRRVWSCAELPPGDGGSSAILGHAHRKGTFWAIPVSLCLSKGISALLEGRRDHEHRESLGSAGGQSQTGPREGSNIEICRTVGLNKQTNKQSEDTFYCYAIRTAPICVFPAQLPLPPGSACIWGRSLCSHEQPSDLQH